MQTPNIKAVFIALCISIQAKVPVILWGSPGIGKTSILKAIANQLKVIIEIIVGNNREPSDVLGLPINTPDGVVYSPPAWAKRLAAAVQGILFLDELTTALPAMQAAFLRVANERVVGEIELGDEISVVAAANPSDIAANGSDLNAALANRFFHLPWGIDSRDWARNMRQVWKGGKKNGFDTPVIVSLPQSWETELEVSYSLIAEFIEKNPQLLDQCPEDIDKAGGAWGSPRSWEMLAVLLGAGRAAKAPKDVIELFVAGTIGNQIAPTFLTWLEKNDLPDPETVLNDPISFQFPKGRNDRVHTICAAIYAAYMRDKTADRYRQALLVMVQAAKQGFADIAFPTVTGLYRNVPPGANRYIPEMCIYDSLLNPVDQSQSSTMLVTA
jgi:MoxR-like ATPase